MLSGLAQNSFDTFGEHLFLTRWKGNRPTFVFLLFDAFDE